MIMAITEAQKTLVQQFIKDKAEKLMRHGINPKLSVKVRMAAPKIEIKQEKVTIKSK